jgi:hypothetical protein
MLGNIRKFEVILRYAGKSYSAILLPWHYIIHDEQQIDDFVGKIISQ